MEYNNQLPHRKSPRLPEYDYSQNGAYFVTVCTEHRKQILSKIVVGKGLCALPQIQIELTKTGKIVEECIEYINPYDFVEVMSYVIMPDHIHLIISIIAPEGHRDPSLQHTIQQFKSYSTHKNGQKFWQRSYYDHIVRNESDLIDIHNYIIQNPYLWFEGKHDDTNFLR